MTKSPKTRFLFRTYTTDGGVDTQASLGCTIWEAARATSAAPTFFDPVNIGGQSFVDGATGLNNPVEVVLEEAKSIWINAISRIQCVVSIGTGVPNFERFGDDVKEVVETLIAISTETEDTERRFLQSHESLGLSGRYFRYNVDKGLGEIGLDEHNEVNWIIRATESYLEEPRVKNTIKDFVTAHDPSICR
jgi:predicted acylesterase/phospholipase RssA